VEVEFKHMAKDEYGIWKIVDGIDEGGQAHVFRVKDRTGDRPGVFALKRLRNAKRIERFKNEVEAVAALKHPNVVPLIDNSAFDAPVSDKAVNIWSCPSPRAAASTTRHVSRAT
jgi:hypothetical protein